MLLNQSFAVVHGDEYSEFNNLDKNIQLELLPVFISYKVKVSGSNSGFKFINCFNSFDELSENEIFKISENIFTGKAEFLKYKKVNL